MIPYLLVLGRNRLAAIHPTLVLVCLSHLKRHVKADDVSFVWSKARQFASTRARNEDQNR